MRSRTTITTDCSVEWIGHPGVFVVMRLKGYCAQVRSRGHAMAPILWVQRFDLLPLTENEAIERLKARDRAEETRMTAMTQTTTAYRADLTYTVTDITGQIIGQAHTAREARRLMTGWTCPMHRYLTADLPAGCLARGYVTGALAELIARDGGGA